MLGGNAEFMAVAELKQRGLDPVETPEEYEQAWPAALEAAHKAVEREHEEVTELGGLYVLGTERHESRRIDNQLRGRSGRQGDPGESRFYLSLQDDLMRLFNSGLVDRFMSGAGIGDDVPIESKLVSRSIASAQSQVEGQNFEIRKNVLKYDDVLNRQREVIYAERRRVLEGEDLHEQVRMFLDDVVAGYVQGATSEGFAEDWDLEQLWTALGSLYPVGITIDELLEEAGGREGLTADMLLAELRSDAEHAYDERERTLGPEVMRELERRVVLSVLDRKWREHLYEMDYLQEGIGLRAMAQRDPLVEYQREGFQLFNAMNEAIKEESVGYVFNLEVEVEPVVEEAAEEEPGAGEEHPHIVAKGLQPPSRPAQLQYTAPSVDGEGGVEVREESTDGRSGGSESASGAGNGSGNGSRADRRSAARSAKKARRR
jgi:preprotein translocase subunit SecA